MKHSVILLSGLQIVCGISAVRAQGDSVSLFNGQDLSGWTVEGDCQFSVRDGLLLLDGGFGWLRSDARYGDFALHVEWRAEKDGFDSGIFIRTSNDGGTPWPNQRYQVNMRSDQVGMIVGDRSSKPVESYRPPGEWNTYDITCRGDRIIVEVNGETVNEARMLKRSIGHIGIQAEEHRFAFRNLRIRELDTKPLFNGRDLTGWTGHDGSVDAWRVEDGVLHCTGEPRGGWLRTESEYRDFDLRLDFKAARDANSGIGLRAASSGNPATTGMEIQIIDEDGPRYKGRLQEWQRTGSLYAKHPPRGDHSKPAGEWNHIEINCRGERVVVWLNGHKVVDADLTADTVEENNLAKRAKSGFIGLQNYGDKVWFRNVRIRTSGT